MADCLLTRIEEQIQDVDGANTVNISLSDSEKSHVAEVQRRLEEDYNYECHVKLFDDWRKGSYTVLTVCLDGASRVVLPDGDPTLKGGLIGS